jgi:hypothetical protein
MDEDLDQVLALKASAKSARDDQDWKGAIEDLLQAINLLSVRMDDTSRRQPDWLVSELADAFGMLGGIEKRWALLLDGQERQLHLEASLTAYNSGFKYEEHLPPSETNTYNRVNRLVGQVLLDPSVLMKDRGAVPELSHALAEAEKILTGQIKSVRQEDPWAYCDLGTVQLLRGEDDALLTYRLLDRLRPEEFVYDSALDTLQPLSKAAADLRPDMDRAVDQLRRSAGYRE